MWLGENMFDKENGNSVFTQIMENWDEIEENSISLYEHPYFKDYFLTCSTQGIGSKAVPLLKKGYYGAIARDLIATNLNSISSKGSIPMFFSYYLSVNKIDSDMKEKFQNALKNSLEQYNCTLLGGRTNEIGEVIEEKQLSVGGFMVGVVKKEKLLDKTNVKEDDLIIGLCSSGAHTSGFEIIQKLKEEGKLSDKSYEAALESSYIYSNVIEKLVSNNLIYSACHITRGGIEKNLSNSIPYGLCANINTELIPKQDLFIELENILGRDVAYQNFNMGIGFCVITSEENCDEVFEIAKEFNPFILGKVKKSITEKEKNSKICLK